MKVHVKTNGKVFEYESHPMPERRFRLLCTLAAVALYVGTLITVTALCGIWGLLLLVVSTLLVLAFTCA